MDMELIEIEAFVTIASSGTFTAAAERLHVSQPAISRRIDLLEAELGAPLFERTRTGVQLTDAGAAFLPFATRVIADLRDGAAAVREMATGNRGTISLAVVGTLANTDLLERIRAFRATHPDVHLQLGTANSNGVSQLVRSGEAQLGLRYYPDRSAGLETTHIADETLVLVRARDSRLAPSRVSGPADLGGIPFVCFPVGTGSSGEPFALEVDRLLGALGLGDAERVVIDSLTAQKRMIEADFGIGLMLESAISEELRLGTLEIIEGLDIDARAPIHLVRRRGGYLSAAMKRLIEALTQG